MVHIETLVSLIPGRWGHHALQTDSLGVTTGFCRRATDGVNSVPGAVGLVDMTGQPAVTEAPHASIGRLRVAADPQR